MYNSLFWNRLKIILGAGCAYTAVACSSPKSMIDDGAIYITGKANETKLIAEEIKVTSTDDAIVGKSEVIVGLQDDIITATSSIRTNTVDSPILCNGHQITIRVISCSLFCR